MKSPSSGYNDKKGEILYSDSWGKGHELKRMPADWAWTITHALLALRPLRQRRFNGSLMRR